MEGILLIARVVSSQLQNPTFQKWKKKKKKKKTRHEKQHKRVGDSSRNISLAPRSSGGG
jgi:hypothetical protein